MGDRLGQHVAHAGQFVARGLRAGDRSDRGGGCRLHRHGRTGRRGHDRGGLASRQALLEGHGQLLGLGVEGGFLGALLGTQGGLAALEHALAYIVLEGQRAHRQAGHVVADLVLGRRRLGGRTGGGLGRRTGRRGACSRLGGRDGCRHALDLLDAFRTHGQHLDAFGAGLGGQHDGVIAERLAHQGQGVARGARAESLDVHAETPGSAFMARDVLTLSSSCRGGART